MVAFKIDLDEVFVCVLKIDDKMDAKVEIQNVITLKYSTEGANVLCVVERRRQTVKANQMIIIVARIIAVEQKQIIGR